MHNHMFEKVKNDEGFIAALDQSGGSTPKALADYGVPADAYKNEDEMFDMVHAMRSRIITSPVFNGSRILGAILFEMTMDRDIEDTPTPTYLWEEKGVVPFLKVDVGLADEADDVQMMKDNPGLPALLDRAYNKNVFGTKMRSVIKEANKTGIKNVVAQQFEVGQQILAAGLIPIIEPEVDIHSKTKADAEAILRDEITASLDQIADDQWVMLKLSLPSEANFYEPLINHPKVLRVVALSGGYSRDEANAKLGQNKGMIASFSRALVQGLSYNQTPDEFNDTLNASIESIYRASIM